MSATGLAVVEGDQSVDDLTAEVELLVWRQLENEDTPTSTLRQLVGVLLILPELERSGDLAEHIAQRAVTHLGVANEPAQPGHRAADVRSGVRNVARRGRRLWRPGRPCRRLGRRRRGDRHPPRSTDREIAAESMPTAIGAQVTLLARFYERLGDHAVNLARRIEMLQGPTPGKGGPKA